MSTFGSPPDLAHDHLTPRPDVPAPRPHPHPNPHPTPSPSPGTAGGGGGCRVRIRIRVRTRVRCVVHGFLSEQPPYTYTCTCHVHVPSFVREFSPAGRKQRVSGHVGRITHRGVDARS